MKKSQTISLILSLAVHGAAGAVALTCLNSRPVQIPSADVPIILEMTVLEPDTLPKPLPAVAVDALPAPSATLAQKQEALALSAPSAVLSAARGFEVRSAVASVSVVSTESRVETLTCASQLAAAVPVFAPADFGPLPVGPAEGSTRGSESPSASFGGAGSIAYRLNPAPRYPAAARREKLEGLVLLRVEVSEEGTALKVEVEQSSGHKSLDTAAVDAVQRWHFEPARAAGRAVKARAQVPIRFKLES
ncbi:MAG: energy transducer TonB [Pedosphaera sp.]|nr:energy transducer TonB [Pedosphaera sp.]MST00224.1 energy transducer TonB [Pedosphaera sp.]